MAEEVLHRINPDRERLPQLSYLQESFVEQQWERPDEYSAAC
jgi:hypothetical protein